MSKFMIRYDYGRLLRLLPLSTRSAVELGERFGTLPADSRSWSSTFQGIATCRFSVLGTCASGHRALPNLEKEPP